MARAGQVIGLLGGSFDPPHAGHVHITKEALKRFALDQVWWLVSPGNPLKTKGPAPLRKRMTAARQIMGHPRVKITDLETRIGTRYTAATLRRLIRLYPGVTFVWLMGGDNLASFHKWDQWRSIMRSVPLGVLARPGSRTEARNSKAASCYARQQLGVRYSVLLAKTPPPRWCFVNVPMLKHSSTEIRSRGGWGDEV